MNAILKAEIAKHLAPFPDAANFLVAYGILCHSVDDLVDLDNPRFPDRKLLILDCYNLACDVYSSRFYHDNLAWIYPLVKAVHRIYSASVVWENSEVKWKAEYANTIRCFGAEMIVAVLEHIAHLPYAELRRLDAALREDSWVRQNKEEEKAA